MSKKRYTPEMVEFLKQNYEGRTISELTELFNNQFNTTSVGTMRNKVRILSGDYIKIEGKIISKARHLFIKYFGEEFPLSDNDVVIFKDGDKKNYSKDNLMKVDKYDLSYLAGLGLYNINKETTEAGLKIVQIMRKLEELKRHKKSN